MTDDTGRIAAESSVRDVIARYPSTGAVFLQYGPLARAQRGNLYLSYPDWTVAEFAGTHDVPLPQLLRQLEAEAARGRPTAAQEAAPSRPPQRGFAQVTIGYTGSYRERNDVDIEERSVVATQSAPARGPE